MDRRKFLKAGAFSLIAARLGIGKAFASEGRQADSERVPVRHFGEVKCENAIAGPEDLQARFLGTGAAGWKAPDGKHRRHSSILLDGKVLIDMTRSVLDTIPEGCGVKTIFYTHSHADHFDPVTAIKLGITKAYVGETWAERARRKFDIASVESGLPAPKVIPLRVGQCVEEEGLRFTALPANHVTGDMSEQALIYLIEKGTTEDRLGVRLLYATDTGGLMGIAARTAGIDSHIKPGRAITALVMEATMPMDCETDFRIFNHSTVETVGRTASCLLETERLILPEGQPVYLTHMSNLYKMTHDELNDRLPYPLRAAKDGLDVVFKALDIKG